MVVLHDRVKSENPGQHFGSVTDMILVIQQKLFFVPLLHEKMVLLACLAINAENL